MKLAIPVCAGRIATVLDFAQTLAQVYGRDVQSELRSEFRPGDFRHLSTDAARLRDLGWEPQVALNDGLRRYADWIQSYTTIEEYFSEAERLLKTTNVVMQTN